VTLEYPDKFYIGTFERTARFEAHLDDTGICLVLDRPGSADVRKSVHMHFHYALFAVSQFEFEAHRLCSIGNIEIAVRPAGIRTK
jgi:hypothetical protein